MKSERKSRREARQTDEETRDQTCLWRENRTKRGATASKLSGLQLLHSHEQVPSVGRIPSKHRNSEDRKLEQETIGCCKQRCVSTPFPFTIILLTHDHWQHAH